MHSYNKHIVIEDFLTPGSIVEGKGGWCAKLIRY